MSLPRNTLYSALSAVSNVLLLVLVIAAGRVLGDTSYGKFSLALAVASISEMAVDFGLNTYAVRSVSRDPALGRDYLSTIVAWKTLLSVAVMLLLVPVSLVLTKAPDTRIAIYALGLAIVLRSFKSTTHAFFRAYERFDLVLLTTYTERVTVLVVCGAILLGSRSLIPFAFAFALARVPDLIYSFWLVHRKIVRLSWRFNRSLVREIQMKALPLGSMNIVIVLYSYIGTVILGLFRPPAEVGWYGAAYRVYEGLTTFPFILVTVLLPRLSRLFVEERGRHAGLTLKVVRYLFIAAPLVAGSAGFAARPVVLAMYGREYLPAVAILQVLSVAALFMFVNWTINTMLVSADGEKISLRITATGLGVMCAANLALVPLLGVVGAAWAVVVSESSVFIMLLLAARRLGCSIPAAALGWRPALAGGVGAVGGFTLGVAAFPVCYLASLLALRAFYAEDWAAARSVIQFRARRQPGNTK
ncbi:MAG: flippase [Armatimonadota bacterium]